MSALYTLCPGCNGLGYTTGADHRQAPCHVCKPHHCRTIAEAGLTTEQVERLLGQLVTLTAALRDVARLAQMKAPHGEVLDLVARALKDARV